MFTRLFLISCALFGGFSDLHADFFMTVRESQLAHHQFLYQLKENHIPEGKNASLKLGIAYELYAKGDMDDSKDILYELAAQRNYILKDYVSYLLSKIHYSQNHFVSSIRWMRRIDFKKWVDPADLYLIIANSFFWRKKSNSAALYYSKYLNEPHSTVYLVFVCF